MTLKQLAYQEAHAQCVYCNTRESLTVDHIHGRDHKNWKKYDNLIILCRACHDKKDHYRVISVEEIKLIKRGLIFRTLGFARLLFAQCVIQGKLKSRRTDVEILLRLRLIRDTGQTRSGKRAYIPTTEGYRFFDQWIR